MRFSIVDHHQNMIKKLDICILHDWVYSIYSVMLINASSVSSHSPFSLIPIKSNVEVQVFNKAKVKFFLSFTLNTTFKYSLVIYSLLYLNSSDYYAPGYKN